MSLAKSTMQTSLRSMLVLSSLLGAAASLLAVACGDDLGSTGAGDAGGDVSPTTLPDADAADAGVDPDARGAFDPADVPVECDASPCATQLVAGVDHFCARMSDGTVRCWGSTSFGATGTMPDGRAQVDSAEAGDGGTTVHVIADLSNVSQISAAGATTCARLGDGTVKCWGDNRTAQLGLELEPPIADEDPHPHPSIVPLESAALRVDVGQGVVCARLTSGKLWCWGKDDQAQLARPGGDAGLDWLNPIRGPGVAALEPLSLMRVAAGTYTMLGLDGQGQVWSWGAAAGKLGIISGRVASVSPLTTPKPIASLQKVTSLVASVWIEPPYDPPPWEPGVPPPPYDPPPPRAHACALADGEVYCWGRSNAGALCTGLPDKEQEPRLAPIEAKTWPQQLAVGDEITCARMTDGSVYCCGSDTKGRLGTGIVGVLSPLFTKAHAFFGYAVQVATSNNAVCALTKAGIVECWGSNQNGELGTKPDAEDHPFPVKIAF